MTALPEHFEPDLQRYCFRKLRDCEMPSRKTRLASGIFDFVVADLQLSGLAPRLVWIEPDRWEVGAEDIDAAVGHAVAGEPSVCNHLWLVEENPDGYVET